MFKAILIILIVVGALVGGLLGLRSSRSAGMPDKEVLARAKQREIEQAAADKHQADRER